jgi:hypothetical protein
MNADLSFDPGTGAICIGDTTRLTAFQKKSTVQALVSPWVGGSRDLQNGYEWLQLRGLTFGRHPAGLSLCFHHGKLISVKWGVSLPGAPTEGRWPTQQAIDQEIAFVRQILAVLFQTELITGALEFSWGAVWSTFDSKGFLASHGIRYRQL